MIIRGIYFGTKKITHTLKNSFWRLLLLQPKYSSLFYNSPHPLPVGKWNCQQIGAIIRTFMYSYASTCTYTYNLRMLNENFADHQWVEIVQAPSPIEENVFKNLSTWYIRIFQKICKLSISSEFSNIWKTTPAPDVASVTGGKVWNNEVVGNGSSYCFVSYWRISRVWSYKNGNGRQTAPRGQNWITSTGGCKNWVPGWHSQRRWRDLSYARKCIQDDFGLFK